MSDKVSRRERRLAERGGKEAGGLGQLLLVGGIAIAIILAAITGGILLINSGGDEPATPSADGSDMNAPTCVVEEFGVGCLPEPQCFTGDLLDGNDMAAVEPIACTEPHNWEAYAVGDLPEDISAPTYGEVRKIDLVKQTCLAAVSEGPLANILGNGVSDWQSDVLPPSKADFDDGSRQFLCVTRPRSGDVTTGSIFGSLCARPGTCLAALRSGLPTKTVGGADPRLAIRAPGRAHSEAHRLHLAALHASLPTKTVGGGSLRLALCFWSASGTMFLVCLRHRQNASTWTARRLRLAACWLRPGRWALLTWVVATGGMGTRKRLGWPAPVPGQNPGRKARSSMNRWARDQPSRKLAVRCVMR